MIFFFIILDNVSNTVQGTIDSTKNVAGSVYDKSASLVTGAKGILYIMFVVIVK